MSAKSERTRQKIVEAANQLFYHKGYANTSFTDVVSAAMVPRGNIYYYFKSKDDILRAAIDYRLDRIQSMLQNWSDTYRTPVERLHRFLEILPSTQESLSLYGCPMGSLNTELAKDFPDLQDKSLSMFQLFEDWLADQFSELGYAGQAEALAKHLLGRGQGIAVMTHVYHDTGFLERETAMLMKWVDGLAAGESA
ncbi:MAG: TetR/AcrR family transcriptional regulator [bacterium]